MKVAFVHDWLVTYRGGEKVLAALLALYPEAPVYTMFYDPKAMPAALNARDVRVPWLANAMRKARKAMLPLLPRVIESLPVTDYDLIISTSSCVAKGVIKRVGARHLCYLHSPMRYIWDQQDEYLEGVKHIPLAVPAIKALTPGLRRWDIDSAQRVDRFVVNSSFVGERCKKYYGRDSVVIAPPVELERFVPAKPTGERDGYVLAAGALVSYKRFDLAIAACEAAGQKLVIAGSGPMEASLRKQAGPMTSFVMQPDDPTFDRLLQGAKALLFPGVEDFGMIAIEAMACGTPVVAYREGGARDFIRPGETGIFFDEPTPASLGAALASFQPTAFDAQRLNDYARRYGRADFLRRIRDEIDHLLKSPAV